MTDDGTELHVNDPAALQEAVRRAEAGKRARLIASDGRHVADVVPPKPAPGADRTDAAVAESDGERADRIVRTLMENGQGCPGFEHYRQVYARLGTPYPGDDQIVARGYPVRQEP